jgi:hypothetical protein
VATTSGIVIALWLERRKKPDLKIECGDPVRQTIPKDPPYNDPPLTRLHVNVRNLPLSPPLSWFWNRETAVGTRAWISFYQDKLGRFKMLGRWKNAGVPQIPSSWIKDRQLPKGLQDTMDIQPYVMTDDIQGLDIAIRCEKEEKDEQGTVQYTEEQECYAWNNENYLYDGGAKNDLNVKFRHPDHSLAAGVYYVKVVVTSGGREFNDLFVLHNDREFMLMAIPDTKEKDKLIKSLPDCRIAKPS